MEVDFFIPSIHSLKIVHKLFGRLGIDAMEVPLFEVPIFSFPTQMVSFVKFQQSIFVLFYKGLNSLMHEMLHISAYFC